MTYSISDIKKLKSMQTETEGGSVFTPEGEFENVGAEIRNQLRKEIIKELEEKK